MFEGNIFYKKLLFFHVGICSHPYIFYNHIVITSSLTIQGKVRGLDSELILLHQKSPKRLFEVKNYANVEVFGTDRAKIWSVKYPNGKMFKPKNPLHQNYGHIKAIEKVLK